MTLVLGLDGCRDGWCGVLIEVRDGATHPLPPSVYRSFDEGLATDARVIAIDIPIGLLALLGGPVQRACDVAARALLGWPRRCSLFPPPARPALAFCHDYRAACRAHETVTGRAIGKQTFNISPKIREVDQLMTAALQDRVYEVHPEVCFHVLNGSSLSHSKKKPQGISERRALLRQMLPDLPQVPAIPRDFGRRCGVDDYADAVVTAWMALCILQGRARRLPDQPEMDARGLRMEIWYPEVLNAAG